MRLTTFFWGLGLLLLAILAMLMAWQVQLGFIAVMIIVLSTFALACIFAALWPTIVRTWQTKHAATEKIAPTTEL